MAPPMKPAALVDGGDSALEREACSSVVRAQRLRLATSDEHKKAWGQYFTPPELAAFAASLPSPEPCAKLRVLDPGAGTGSLGLSLVRRLLEQGLADQVELYCVETEAQALRELEASVAEAKLEFGERFTGIVLACDFLEFAAPRLGGPSLPEFDVAISNPPYFKLSPKDQRGGDAPNIYARFMEVASKLLRPRGQLCFIVPRSYASGPYFRRFRKRFHHAMQLERVHVFESRSEAFKTDNVLQENIVVLYTKQRPAATGKVTISSSEGSADIGAHRALKCTRRDLVSDDDNAVVSLPTTANQLKLMKRVRALPSTLESLGLQISTGPVVAFRAADSLVDEDEPDEQSVPLLWLQHVRKGQVSWPLGAKFRKSERIRLSAGDKLLVANANYVVLRRFSAKEEPRRLTAAPLLARDWKFAKLGLENHLNFIHRPGGALTIDETHGLTALLNSRVLDDFFRVSSGNTQVSATEVCALRLPRREDIEALGRALGGGELSEDRVDELVESLVNDATR